MADSNIALKKTLQVRSKTVHRTISLGELPGRPPWRRQPQQHGEVSFPCYPGSLPQLLHLASAWLHPHVRTCRKHHTSVTVTAVNVRTTMNYQDVFNGVS